MNGLQNLFSKQDDVHSLIAGIDEGLKEQIVSGLTGSSRSLLLASVYEDEFQAVVLVEGTTLFKELEIDKELDSLTVRPKIIFDVLDRVRKKQVDDND